jgi:PAS domain-containing protein
MPDRPIAFEFRSVGLKVAVTLLSLLSSLGARVVRPLAKLHYRAEAMLGEAGGSAAPRRQVRIEPDAANGARRDLAGPAARRQGEIQVLLERIEAVLDYADVGIALTRNGCFELVSRQFCHIFRCEKLQIVGQSTRSIHASEEAYQALSERARPAFMAHGAFDSNEATVRCSGPTCAAAPWCRATAPKARSGSSRT